MENVKNLQKKELITEIKKPSNTVKNHGFLIHRKPTVFECFMFGAPKIY